MMKVICICYILVIVIAKGKCNLMLYVAREIYGKTNQEKKKKE